MDAQMLMLYILILVNQIVAYGALIYLATNAGNKKLKPPCEISKKPEKTSKKQSQNEEAADKSGKYLDYINKFEVEA